MPIIDGYFAVDNQAEADRVHQYYPSYTALTPAAFHDMFYPGEPTYVPEPATITSLLTGLLAGSLVLARRRKLWRTPTDRESEQVRGGLSGAKAFALLPGSGNTFTALPPRPKCAVALVTSRLF